MLCGGEGNIQIVDSFDNAPSFSPKWKECFAVFAKRFVEPPKVTVGFGLKEIQKKPKEK